MTSSPTPSSDETTGRLPALKNFIRAEASSGIVLFIAALVALVWVNLVDQGSYEGLWETKLSVGIGDFAIDEDLRHWVNDGLMALFFFVVGMEIKRELAVGELSNRAAATLPAVAAVGGALLPAAIFALVVGGGEEAKGWAIPMATDIAFAVGVVALLGDRISDGVKLLILAIAVVDDVLAISVIAIFYSDDLSLPWLAATVGGLLVMTAMHRLLGLTRIALYVAVGVVVWVCAHESGVHATIAGVVIGLLTPSGRVKGREVLEDLEHAMHPYTSLLVVPVFALANAGVFLGDGVLGEALSSTLAWAIVLGLVLGKLVGITGTVLAAVRTGIATMPAGISRAQLPGLAAIGGIGFTVSLFITGLAFDDEVLRDQATVGVFLGSIISGVIGAVMLRHASRDPTPGGPRFWERARPG